MCYARPQSFVPRDGPVALRGKPAAEPARVAGFTVLHVHQDFDLVAGITGQPTERLRG